MEPSLEQRVQRLEDKAALWDLAGEYCNAIDDLDIERLEPLFTRDSVYHSMDNVTVFHNRAEIVQHFREFFPVQPVCFHYPHSQSITFDGPDDAHGFVNGHVDVGYPSDGSFLLGALRYYDRYRREDGQWRFAERILKCWYWMKLTDLPTGFKDEIRNHLRGMRLPAHLPEELETYRALHPVPVG